MGMYTLLAVDFHLKTDTPADVREMLRYMADTDHQEDEDGNEYPVPALAFEGDPLFATANWRYMLNGVSSYFEEETGTLLAGDLVRLQVVLKNYDSEIEKFLDWIVPHVDGARLPVVDGRPFLGRYCTEGDDNLGVYLARAAAGWCFGPIDPSRACWSPFVATTLHDEDARFAACERINDLARRRDVHLHVGYKGGVEGLSLQDLARLADDMTAAAEVLP